MYVCVSQPKFYFYYLTQKALTDGTTYANSSNFRFSCAPVIVNKILTAISYLSKSWLAK